MMSYRESLQNTANIKPFVPVLDAKKIEQFQKFQKFLEWEAAQEAADKASVDTNSSWIKKKEAFVVRKIDYEKVMNILMGVMGCRSGSNPSLFWHFKHLYNENPKDFTLTGELHTDDLGANYFSFSYKRGTLAQVNFHAHGLLNCSSGTQKFLVERVDIFINREAYYDAAILNSEEPSY